MLHSFKEQIVALLAQIGLHPGWLAYAAPVSALTIVATALLTPWLVARIPEDYFVRRRRREHSGHWILRLVMLVLKNALGALLLMAGISMLVLPGPGVLTILGALALLNVPGKRALERWVVSWPGVRSLIDLLRARAGRPPLRLPARRPPRS